MSQGVSVWVVLLVALFAANLPFVSNRLLGVLRLSGGGKSLALRLGELVLLYGVTGAVGALFEHRAGQIAPQGWEFYAITASLFVVLAFPGFVYRYMLKHRH